MTTETDGAMIEDVDPDEGNLKFRTSPPTIEERRESVRSIAAFTMLAALVVIIAIGAVGWFQELELSAWVSFTAPIVTIIAAATGFYFRGES